MSNYFEMPDLWAEKEYTSEADAERVRLALEWLPAGIESILDLGCGNGIFINQMTGRMAVGVDRSLAALRYVRGLRCQADAGALPFADRSFDAVVAMELIEHLPVPIYSVALAEMARVARRYLLITVPYCEDLTLSHVICPLCGCSFHPSGHVHSYSRIGLEHLFQDSGGFRLVRMEGIVPHHVLRFPRLRRCLARLLRRTPPYPRFAVCPQCGYKRGQEKSQEVTPSAAKAPWSGLRRFWPVQRTYIWWMALYEMHNPE